MKPTVVTLTALLLAPLAALHAAENQTSLTPASSGFAPIGPPPGMRKLIDTPLRDPSICRGPAGTYYLTGTSEPFWGFNNEHGIRVWKSKDLATWEPLGTVWRYGSSPWHEKYLEARKPLWAPEIFKTATGNGGPRISVRQRMNGLRF